MVKGKVINGYTHRRIFGYQNRYEPGSSDTAANCIKTILLQNINVRSKLGDCGQVSDKGILNLGFCEGRDRHSQILLGNFSFGSSDYNFLEL